jgi:hypothetical protein
MGKEEGSIQAGTPMSNEAGEELKPRLKNGKKRR